MQRTVCPPGSGERWAYGLGAISSGGRSHTHTVVASEKVYSGPTAFTTVDFP
jgi:hypothetical protein